MGSGAFQGIRLPAVLTGHCTVGLLEFTGWTLRGAREERQISNFRIVVGCSTKLGGKWSPEDKWMNGRKRRLGKEKEGEEFLSGCYLEDVGENTQVTITQGGDLGKKRGKKIARNNASTCTEREQHSAPGQNVAGVAGGGTWKIVRVKWEKQSRGETGTTQ